MPCDDILRIMEGENDETPDAPDTPTDEPKPAPVQDPPAEPDPAPYVVRSRTALYGGQGLSAPVGHS
jgi:hypothetical protein